MKRQVYSQYDEAIMDAAKLRGLIEIVGKLSRQVSSMEEEMLLYEAV